MKVAVLSDIHGNLAALNAVVARLWEMSIWGVAVLGDLIDYGPHSNEAVERLGRFLEKRTVCANLWGNHELAAVSGEYGRFASERGARCAAYTRKTLSGETMDYLTDRMDTEGVKHFYCAGKSCLAAHGSLDDAYWGSITAETEADGYAQYDYVFSGHTHIPHYFTKWAETGNPVLRDRKPVHFVNPGSVGQPRSQNPRAQFAVWDTDSGGVEFVAVPYDIEEEQRHFSDEVDAFYRERLQRGI